MGKANRATAWRFSKIEIKSRLRAMFDAPIR
jgi:hypothetical protein